MTDVDIQELVLRAVQNINLARESKGQLDVSPQAALFGPDSPLDSLGLVSLLMDVEEALSERGFDVVLSDARAMSRSVSPFRTVPALVAYIREHLGATS